MHPVRGPPRVQQEKEPLLPPKALQHGAGLALAAVQPPRWPRTAGSFRDSPHLALAHAGDPLLTPTPVTEAGILECQCPQPPMASSTGKRMHRAIPSLQKHLQGHQLSSQKILHPSLHLPDGSIPLLPLPLPSPRERVLCYGSPVSHSPQHWTRCWVWPLNLC